MISKMLTNPRAITCRGHTVAATLYYACKVTSNASRNCAGYCNKMWLRKPIKVYDCKRKYHILCGKRYKEDIRSDDNMHNIIQKKILQRCLHVDLPTPRSLPLFGTMLSLIRAGGAPKLHEYVDKRHKQLGPIFKEKLGNVEAVFISDPEYMRIVFAHEGKYPSHVLPEAWILYNQIYGCSRGLFFMEMEEWLHNRRIMNNLLLKGDLTYMEESCDLIACDTIKQLPNCNLEKVLYRWSLNTLVAILLGSNEYKANKNKFDSNLEQLSNTVHLVFECSAKLQLVPANLAAKLKLPAWNNFVKSVDDALYDANELVHLLNKLFPKNSGLLGLMMNKNMPKSDIIKIIVDLVLAAGDTTAYTMQWILYLLAKHQNLQEDLLNELNFMDSNVLLKNFVKETLRMYPVAPFLTRYLPNDTQMGPYVLPKNTLSIISLFTSGRDGNIYKRPDCFDPNRWLNKTPAMVQASLPFAMGSRSCVGRKIAEAQLHATLGHVVKKYKVDLVDDGNVDIILKMVAVPSKPIKLKFTER